MKWITSCFEEVHKICNFTIDNHWKIVHLLNKLKSVHSFSTIIIWNVIHELNVTHYETSQIHQFICVTMNQTLQYFTERKYNAFVTRLVLNVLSTKTHLLGSETNWNNFFSHVFHYIISRINIPYKMYSVHSRQTQLSH